MVVDGWGMLRRGFAWWRPGLRRDILTGGSRNCGDAVTPRGTISMAQREGRKCTGFSPILPSSLLKCLALAEPSWKPGDGSLENSACRGMQTRADKQ